MINGIRLPGKKEATLLVWTIRRLQPPKKINIPLRLDAQRYAKPLVEAGDRVKPGQKIAEAATPESVPIFSSVHGTVLSLSECAHPFLGTCEAVAIECDTLDPKSTETFSERPQWESLGRETLLELFRENGLVDLEPESLPVHVMAARKVKTLVLNACEPEPYQTCDHALMMSHPLEVLKGGEILRRAVQAEKMIVVIQDDKLEVAETLKSKVFFMKWKNVEIEIIPSLFPQGKTAMLRRRFKTEEASVFNIAAAYAVYEAIVSQKPFYERVVTVAGECVIEPKNIWARIGLDFDAAFKAGRGLLRQPRKVVAGGPMGGVTQRTLEPVVVPGLTALLALPEELTKPETPESCIRSGECVSVCPVEIHPAMITLSSENGFKSLAFQYGADLCIECGNCSYVCPSKRPLLEWIRDVKRIGPVKARAPRTRKKREV